MSEYTDLINCQLHARILELEATNAALHERILKLAEAIASRPVIFCIDPSTAKE